MTVSKSKSTKRGNSKLTAEVVKKSKLTTEQMQGVDSVWDWYTSQQPASYARLFDAVNLLDTLVNGTPDAFHERLLTAYYDDNPRHSLVEELKRVAAITKSPIFAEMADQLASL